VKWAYGILFVILSLMVAKLVGVPFFPHAVGLVGALWLFAGTGGGASLMLTGLGAIKRLLVSFVVFVGIMMPVNRFIEVDPYRVYQEFKFLGIRPWGWPADIPLPVILWTCLAFLAAGIAGKAADGHKGLAVSIFAFSAVCIFVSQQSTYFKEALRPKADWSDEEKPANTTNKDEADKAFAQQGLLGVGWKSTATFLLGESKKKDKSKTSQDSYVPPAPPTIPTSGQGFAKEGEPLRAYFRPPRTRTHPAGEVRYEVEGHPDISILDGPRPGEQEAEDRWGRMPTGWYLVYPTDAKEVFVRWD